MDKSIKLFGDQKRIDGVKEAYKNLLAKKDLKELITTFISNKGNRYSLGNYFLAYASSVVFNRGVFEGEMKGFKQWNKEQVRIKKGRIGLDILIPLYQNLKYKLGDKRFFHDDWSYYTVVENNGSKVKFQKDNDKTKTKIIELKSLPDRANYGFKLGKVFDISQTDKYSQYLEEKAKHLQEKDKIIYNNNLGLDFEYILAIVKANFNKYISIEEPKGESKGHYNELTGEIVLYRKDTHTLMHEWGHSLTLGLIKKEDKDSYAKGEILAELFALLLQQLLGK